MEKGERRENEMTREGKKETRGGTDWGGEREGSASISSPVFSGKGGARERGRKDFGEGQRWRCASWPRSGHFGPLLLFKSSCFCSACCCRELEMTSSATPSPLLYLSLHFFSLFFVFPLFFSLFFMSLLCLTPFCAPKCINFLLHSSGKLAQAFKRYLMHRNICRVSECVHWVSFCLSVSV